MNPVRYELVIYDHLDFEPENTVITQSFNKPYLEEMLKEYLSINDIVGYDKVAGFIREEYIPKGLFELRYAIIESLLETLDIGDYYEVDTDDRTIKVTKGDKEVVEDKIKEYASKFPVLIPDLLEYTVIDHYDREENK